MVTASLGRETKADYGGGGGGKKEGFSCLRFFRKLHDMVNRSIRTGLARSTIVHYCQYVERRECGDYRIGEWEDCTSRWR